MSKSPAIEVARDIANEKEIVVLSTGYRAKIVPVAATLIDAAVSKIQDPPVPMVFIKDQDRNEPNPNDPAYQRALQEANRERSMASIDCMVLMGVELLDPVPIEGKWLLGLKRLERLGRIDLSLYDMEDPLDMEFVFKRFVAVGNEDLELITKKMGITEADLKAAEAAFPRNP
jgi:hypothetical protein